MQVLTFTVILASASAGICGDLIITGGKDLQAINPWLRPLSDPKADPRLPDNFVDADDKNPYQWKNLKPGKYVICLDPDYEDWSSHCIAGVPVTVGDGLTKLDVVVPSGTVDITLSFDGVDHPKQRKGDSLVFRVERIEKNSKVNPYYRQWLWSKQTGDNFAGTLSYLDQGRYRFVAFSVSDKFVSKDVGYGELVVDETTIKKGAAVVTINNRVEKVVAPDR